MGTAVVTLSLDSWKGVPVAPTTHSLKVLLPKTKLKEEPVASCLVASLIHPERLASIWTLAFSPDGRKLFTAGYPSGIVEIWDVASRQEVTRINTPPGLRGSANYALITPDWKTLYVPVSKRLVRPVERAGKRDHWIEYAGEVRVWNLSTGKEQAPLRPAAGSGTVTAWLSPNGRLLVCTENPSYLLSDRHALQRTIVWDLATRRKWKLCDGYANPSFAPDGKVVAIAQNDREQKTSAVTLLDLATGKELRRWTWPEKDRYVSGATFSPKGSVIAVAVGGKKGAPVEEWFLDGKTLMPRGKLIGQGAADRAGWSVGRFTPDSRYYILLDGVGNALVWDVAGQHLERKLPLGGDEWAWPIAISPDGKTLAAAWQKIPPEVANAPSPDPRDLPQPRVSVVDLSGKVAPRVLIAPHGYDGGLAFSPDGKLLAFGSCGAVHLFDLTK